jgi:hypothetical protein
LMHDHAQRSERRLADLIKDQTPVLCNEVIHGVACNRETYPCQQENLVISQTVPDQFQSEFWRIFHLATYSR